jgi:hypothetical protein
LTAFRIFKDKMVLTVNDNLYDVELYFPWKELIENGGYLKGEYVYIYSPDATFKGVDQMPTGLYDVAGKRVFVLNDNDKHLWHIDNIVELSIDRIFDDVSKHEYDFIDPDEALAINSNREMFQPEINSNDDPWKYIIKRVILEKKINLNNYKSQFERSHDLNNMRSALERDTKMSAKYFEAWCDLLGIDWKIIIMDNGRDKIAPLEDDIEVSSTDQW